MVYLGIAFSWNIDGVWCFAKIPFTLVENEYTLFMCALWDDNVFCNYVAHDMAIDLFQTA